ncbi:hypothetical protein PGB28_15875 [Primorskyibacter aestuariivivens]|uniref:hypothetical protein n=1 Tax=Primorskyibacter aestuariivivens TaxID=1888912 RepID=UPI0023015FAD|nr:hypothetical protein [Primorskyibacter aestuariivivens]MDA7429944.1 hypothetical protein [Primorskyibacter aestuariivivens]
MTKYIAVAGAALLALSAPVFAQGQSSSAKSMAAAIQSAGNGSLPASEIKGGWGNAVGPATGTNGNNAVGAKPN